MDSWTLLVRANQILLLAPQSAMDQVVYLGLLSLGGVVFIPSTYSQEWSKASSMLMDHMGQFSCPSSFSMARATLLRVDSEWSAGVGDVVSAIVLWSYFQNRSDRTSLVGQTFSGGGRPGVRLSSKVVWAHNLFNAGATI